MDEIPDRLPAQVWNRLASLPDEVGWRRLQVRRRLVAARELHGLDQRALQQRLNAWPQRGYYGLKATDVGTVERCQKDLMYGFELGLTDVLELPPDWFRAPLDQLFRLGRDDDEPTVGVEAAVAEIEKTAKGARRPRRAPGAAVGKGRGKKSR